MIPMKGYNQPSILFILGLIWFPRSQSENSIVERFNFKREITADTNIACYNGKSPFIFDESYQAGRIISPGYNVDAYYTANAYCQWIIKAPENKVIYFFMEKSAFGLDPEGIANLAFYEGGGTVMRVQRRQMNISQNFLSSTNVVKIIFRGIARPKEKGFEFYFSHVNKPTECFSPNDRACRNKYQCYSASAECNSAANCDDGTDEERCLHEPRHINFPYPCGVPVVKPSILGAHIFGGEKVIEGSWPWLASIRYSKFVPIDHLCGAALINRLWLVTAAHCLYRVPINNFQVHFGRFNSIIPTTGKEVYRNIEKVVIHPYFVWDLDANESLKPNTTYDIAMIKLNAPVPVDNDYIRPICLADSETPLRENSAAYVIGWGIPQKIDTEDLFLKQGEVPLISLSRCRCQLPSDAEVIGQHVICAGRLEGGTDSCEGDSGGPLMVYDSRNSKWKLVGIVAQGVKACGEAGKPGVYTSIPFFRDWIIETIDESTR